MAEDTRDTLMAIMVQGKWLNAESQSVVNVKDDLLVNSGEFAPKTFCSLDEFEVEISAQDKDEAEDPDKKQEQTENMAKELHKKVQDLEKQIASLKNAGKDGDTKGGSAPPRSTQQFSRFLKMGAGGIKGTDAYPVELEPISITRRMDAASVALFDHCQNVMILDKAVVLKRRAVGLDELRTYLRIEFIDMLITDFDWQEGEVIKETFKFICREVKISYRPEMRGQKAGIGGKDDGMGKTIGPMGWKLIDIDRQT